MPRKSQTEIEEEITKLKGLAEKIPQRSTFGNNNRSAIDAQIRALSEDLSEDDVFDLQAEEEFDDNETDHARDAANWASGDEDDAPSVGWTPLAK